MAGSPQQVRQSLAGATGVLGRMPAGLERIPCRIARTMGLGNGRYNLPRAYRPAASCLAALVPWPPRHGNGLA